MDGSSPRNIHGSALLFPNLTSPCVGVRSEMIMTDVQNSLSRNDSFLASEGLAGLVDHIRMKISSWMITELND